MKFLPFLTLLLGFASLVQAQGSFRFSADSMSSVVAEGREKTLLNGNARMTSDATQIRADRVELSGRDFRFALAKGTVSASNADKGILLRCQELRYDRDKKISIVTGDVIMEDQKNEMVVKGGYLENYEDDDLIIIQIGVRILKKDLTARSQYARFNRKTDELELSGLPLVVYKGDEYRARKILINVKTNAITMEGEVSGSVIREKKESEVPAPATESPTPSQETPEQIPRTALPSPAPAPSEESPEVQPVAPEEGEF